ncbi:NAD-dependent epimerase/dehydratase family protein [Ideonella sp. B7]|uniref:NAD-dependent epimerase/dehydratase family protein n=1 Tax=Ideonella benzenivorans TaxID=2831643 RepID=UPI001CED4545|nr:NAD-dependent epimerase/dehydratase family protein [Ideonella benzenivorans]MCA6216840.1 NAD-dependent epimerase/dehydratase family protein [Ideonella benzenivorans]
MKSYVIGGNGFLGRHVSAWLEKDGVVRKAPAYDDANPANWQATVLEDMRQFSPDVVLIPGASQAMGDDATAIQALIASNCVLPCLVAEQMLEHSPNSTLVVFGTSWQFADSNVFRPFNLYAASKQAGQDLLTHYALRGLKILQLIMFDTYGEDDSRRKLLKILQDACARGEEIGTTPGEQEIDLVHVDDACAGIVSAIREVQGWDPSQGVMVRGLGSGKPIRVKELISRVSERAGKALRANIGERSYRPREVMQAYRNYRRPAGWEPARTEFQDTTCPEDREGDLAN